MSLTTSPITEIVEVDLYEANATYIRANQSNQKSRFVTLALTYHGEPYEIPEGVVARVQGSRPDGEPILNDCTINGNEITFELTEYMLEVPGTASIEIGIYDDVSNSLLTSSSFHLIIPPSPLDAFKITATTEFTTLINALNKVDKIVTNGENAIKAFEEIKLQWNKIYEDGTQLITDLGILKEEIEQIKTDGTQAIDQIKQTDNAIKLAEESRVEAEKIRVSNEIERIQNENERKSSFSSMQQTISQKIGEIDNAVQSANQATLSANQAASDANQTNESIKLAEQDRVNAETLRVQAETKREEAENTRKQNEEQRQQNFTQKIGEIDSKISAADTATQNANLAADRANKAAEVCEGIIDGTGLIPSTEKGAPNGVATLDGEGKIPSAQLPSYVDDVIEVGTYEDLPPTGEIGKIYVTTSDSSTSAHRANEQYRWSGTQYIKLSNDIKVIQSVEEPAGLMENDVWEKIL